MIKLEAPMLDSGDTDASVTAIAVPCMRSLTSAVTSSLFSESRKIYPN